MKMEKYLDYNCKEWDDLTWFEQNEFESSLICVNHPNSKFKRYDFEREWRRSYTRYPTAFECIECIETEAGMDTTIYHFCPACGMIEGIFEERYYISSPDSWATLSGREGYHYYCKKCDCVIGYSYHTIS